ncbi:MAG: PEP/pyruvate-binding domain-containing protein, partial [Thermoplasmatota archaeon]
TLANDVKQRQPDLPVVFLGDDTPKIREIEREDGSIDEVFTWSGDGKIIVSIIQYIEDKVNLNKGSLKSEGRGILLIEDSIEYYSDFLSIIYEEIWNYIESIIHDGLNRERKLARYRRRPYVLLATDFDEGNDYYEDHKDNLLCILTDNTYKKNGEVKRDAGLDFAEKVKEENPDLPIIVQSSEHLEEGREINDKVKFLLKSSPDLSEGIREFIRESLGPIELVFKDENDITVAEITTIDELEDSIWDIDSDRIYEKVKDDSLAKWLEARAEFELKEKVKEIQEEKPERVKKILINILEEYKYAVHKGSISDFRRGDYGQHVKMSRIGKGSLGGKARGLAFMSKLVSNYFSDDPFDDLNITIPRSIVLSTEVYEKFLTENELLDPYIFELSDERIAGKFMNGSLPATVLGNLRTFIRNTRNPLIVRSSGVLEDSMMEPFAGVYASMLLPNESWETDLRFREVCNAIKYVFASSFFEEARNYIKSTPKKLGDEKMAVILQEVVGKKHEKYYYPAISGVAKSYNHYPSGPCKPEDGIVYLAVGLGKSIVDGGCSYCFCPEKPDAPMFGTPKDFMKYSQRKFYALNLESVYRIVKKNEETSLSHLDIDIAEKHGVLDKCVSTYSTKNDRLYPGTGHDGPRVVDFAPIVNHKAIPLAKALNLLLKVSELKLGYPVEIEFAVNLNEESDEPAELVILQIRSMMSNERSPDIDIGEYDSKNLLCYSKNSLGNGVMDEIYDIVYTDQDLFDLSKSQKAVQKIKKINKKLMDEERPYILIGPGRWGSSDEWLGIPVMWGDIAGAKVIVEIPAQDRSIEPSQGSHFFHDMISSQSGYMITKEGEGNIDWEWLEDQAKIDDLEYIKHVRSEKPLEVRLDGKSGKGVIIKKVNNHNEKG